MNLAKRAGKRVVLPIVCILMLLAGCREKEAAQPVEPIAAIEPAAAAPAPKSDAPSPVFPADIEGPGEPRGFQARMPAPMTLKPALSREPRTSESEAPGLTEAEASNDAGNVLFYANPGDLFRFIDSDGEWVSVESEMGEVWSPAWYGSRFAAEAMPIAPERIAISGNAELSLVPGSSVRYRPDDVASSGDGAAAAVAVWKWNDWLGAAFPLDRWQDGKPIRRPLLLWVKQTAVASAERLENGLLAPEDGIPPEAARHIAEVALYKGMDGEAVRRLLGAPHFTESSRPLSNPGEPLRIAADWRYEFPSAHLAVTLDEQNKLAGWRWRLPLDRPELLDLYAARYPHHIEYEFRSLGIVPSSEPDWEWRHKGELAFTYLLDATEDALLLQGDDGGYSGMHYNSNMFAVDRKSGEKLWQIDAGFGWATALVAPGSGAATVLTHYDPVLKRYEERLRTVRLRDGTIVWERTLPEERGSLYAAGGAIVHSVQPDAGRPKGMLSAFDAATGKPRWRREYEQPYEVLNVGVRDPYILVKRQETIEALHPVSGSVVWRVQTDVPLDGKLMRYVMSFRHAETDPFKPVGRNRWVLLGGERLLVDTAKGDVIARYALKADEWINAVDESHWLIQRPLDGANASDGKQFETVLYDPIAASQAWKLAGKATGAAIAGDRIYLTLDGKPTAVDLKTGTIVWQSGASAVVNPNVANAGPAPLAYGDVVLWPYGSDLLVVRAKDGKAIYRVRDMQVGIPAGRSPGSLGAVLGQDRDGAVYVGSSNGFLAKLRLP
ncbi:outer membrane protein assembly factor BamB family protein [Paenibacillus sp. GYB003]|uniref:outer membrane protein assembly factor BamB family protein n=1 Tax=Paenibacillus sp. GYB003 TaxID=2994392 RepID=UPI002F9643D6